METIDQCPVCGNTHFLPFLTCKDYLVSKKNFTIQQCSSCSFRLTNPQPTADSIGEYYKSEDYVSHNDSGGGIMNTAYRAVRSYTLQSKLSLVNKLNNGRGRILDVGCGTGAFLETCKKGGWEVMGMEPDPDARAISTQKLRVDIKSSLADLTKAGPFDIISLWHVLEHIPDLNQAIAQLHVLLGDRGTVVIAVPNSDSYDAGYFKEYWAAYDVPRHLHHFTPSTIEPLFSKHKFKLVEQRPMLFDALYIGMLSTRYQTGETDYLKSGRIGIRSNIQAKRTGNYSSLTYLFKKA